MKEDAWQTTMMLLKKAFEEEKSAEVLNLLLTPDEKESLMIRVKIIETLLNGSISQRQLRDQLGIGIATVTRGSNSLKNASDELKAWLAQTLNKTS